jgi:hypothetical protein
VENRFPAGARAGAINPGNRVMSGDDLLYTFPPKKHRAFTTQFVHSLIV